METSYCWQLRNISQKHPHKVTETMAADKARREEEVALACKVVEETARRLAKKRVVEEASRKKAKEYIA